MSMIPDPTQHTTPNPDHLLVWLTITEGRSPAEVDALLGVVEATVAAMDVAAEQRAREAVAR